MVDLFTYSKELAYILKLVFKQMMRPPGGLSPAAGGSGLRDSFSLSVNDLV